MILTQIKMKERVKEPLKERLQRILIEEYHYATVSDGSLEPIDNEVELFAILMKQTQGGYMKL